MTSKSEKKHTQRDSSHRKTSHRVETYKKECKCVQESPFLLEKGDCFTESSSAFVYTGDEKKCEKTCKNTCELKLSVDNKNSPSVPTLPSTNGTFSATFVPDWNPTTSSDSLFSISKTFTVRNLGTTPITDLYLSGVPTQFKFIYNGTPPTLPINQNETRTFSLQLTKTGSGGFFSPEAFIRFNAANIVGSNPPSILGYCIIYLPSTFIQ